MSSVQIQPGSSVGAGSSIVNVDESAPGASSAGAVTYDVAGAALSPGQSITLGSSGGKLAAILCNAAHASTSFCTGVATSATKVQAGGIVRLTVAEWDAVIAEGSSTGLTIGAPYFLSDADAGKITATPPATSHHFVTLVGWALSPTELLFLPTTPLQNA